MGLLPRLALDLERMSVWAAWCQVRTLPQRCDVYDDVATGALRELCLNFYDARAIVVEVCRRADDLCNSLGGAEQWQRQLAALEALQIFAPMGHALGLVSICAELEDRCFQVGAPFFVAQSRHRFLIGMLEARRV